MIPLSSTEIFDHIARYLLGTSPANNRLAIEDGSNDTFVVSDFGWTMYLPVFGGGDCDPSQVNPESVFIREGVPTDKRTGERKFFVRDATAPSIEIVAVRSYPNAISAVVDNLVPTYKPRCVSPVLDRQEFYGSRRDGFHVILKFLGRHIESLSPNQAPRTFAIQQAYRSLHDNLWRTYCTQRCDCSPAKNETEEPTLPLDAVTAVGQWAWHTLERPQKKAERYLPERVIIVLVRGDRKARWLAVGTALEAAKTRQTMLRGLNCCETCAVNAALKRPGRWFVII
jgi:hypothetical protein